MAPAAAAVVSSSSSSCLGSGNRSGSAAGLHAKNRRIISSCRCSPSSSSSAAGGSDQSRPIGFKRPVSLSTFREEPFIGGSGGDGRRGGIFPGGGGGGGGGSGSDSGGIFKGGGIFAAFLSGWEDRVRADPQFPFKVAMEEIVGVGANVLGDMASRPNFGLNELDFVFSTMVVGSLVNFTLMYMLAPTSSASSCSLPGIFSACPSSHMFEPGNFSIAARAGTFVYKGAVFAAVGFAAGLFGTALSNLLLKARKKMDPNFVMQNEPPPTVLNAATWAAHMGFSSNLRYQALNGLEFALARVLHPTAFKVSVLATRAINNLLGGYTFVALARLTGSQKPSKVVIQMDEVEPKEKTS